MQLWVLVFWSLIEDLIQICLQIKPFLNQTADIEYYFCYKSYLSFFIAKS